jgi:hypothetical protein
VSPIDEWERVLDVVARLSGETWYHDTRPDYLVLGYPYYVLLSSGSGYHVAPDGRRMLDYGSYRAGLPTGFV